jgi:pimeloyl-ACP methyl ester carboxylesterase
VTASTPDALAVEDHTTSVETDRGRFPVVDYGAGAPVVLLHGFPDTRHLWRYQVPALAAAGYRVIAPDMRGFGDAPRPEGVEAYQLFEPVSDVLALLDALDVDRSRVVGHDWGAATAWILAAYNPERVERLVALSVGAPGTSGRFTVEQIRKAWYFYFFQFEAAEAWLRHDDWALFRAWTDGEGDTERNIELLSRPGALTAALNWYRANVRPKPPAESRAGYPDIACPTLGVWSDGDRYLTEGYMRGSAEKVAGEWRYERVTGASHWLQLDRPRRVNELLVEFLDG